MVEVTETFYGKTFPLENENAKEMAEAFAEKVNGIDGWKGDSFKSKRYYGTAFTCKVLFKDNEEYKNFKVLNDKFVSGLKALGYTDIDFDRIERNTTVSVLSYEKPSTFKDWHSKK